ELNPRSGGADDKNPSGPELPGVAIMRRHDLSDSLREMLCLRWHERAIVIPRGDDHVTRMPLAAARLNLEMFPLAFHGEHGGVSFNRRSERGGIVFEEVDDFCHGHVRLE